MAQAFSVVESYSQGNSNFGYTHSGTVEDRYYPSPSSYWYLFDGYSSITANLVGHSAQVVKFDVGLYAYRDTKVQLYSDISPFPTSQCLRDD